MVLQPSHKSHDSEEDDAVAESAPAVRDVHHAPSGRNPDPLGPTHGLLTVKAEPPPLSQSKPRATLPATLHPVDAPLRPPSQRCRRIKGDHQIDPTSIDTLPLAPSKPKHISPLGAALDAGEALEAEHERLASLRKPEATVPLLHRREAMMPSTLVPQQHHQVAPPSQGSRPQEPSHREAASQHAAAAPLEAQEGKGATAASTQVAVARSSSTAQPTAMSHVPCPPEVGLQEPLERKRKVSVRHEMPLPPRPSLLPRSRAP